LLLAFLEKGTPAFRNHRLKVGLRKIIQASADDLFPRQTQELAGADTGLEVAALIVREQNRCGRMEYDRSEQQLEFLRPVFDEPTVCLWLRGHYAFSFFPPIQEGGCLRNTFSSKQSGAGIAVKYLFYHRRPRRHP
jgi:hypothetical protein